MKVFKSKMKHPGATNWMNGVTEKWIAKHGHKIKELNKVELSLQKMIILGQRIELAIETVKKGYAEIKSRYDEIIKAIEGAFDAIRKLIDEINELVNNLSEIKDQVKRIIDRMRKNRNEMRELLEALKKELDKNGILDEIIDEYEKQLEEYNEETKEQVKKIYQLIEENKPTFIDEIEKQLQDFYRNRIPPLRMPIPDFEMPSPRDIFKMNIFGYLKSERPTDAKMIEDGIQLAQADQRLTQEHISASSMERLASLDSKLDDTERYA